jgi:hypothetical protein
MWYVFLEAGTAFVDITQMSFVLQSVNTTKMFFGKVTSAIQYHNKRRNSLIRRTHEQHTQNMVYLNMQHTQNMAHSNTQHIQHIIYPNITNPTHGTHNIQYTQHMAHPNTTHLIHRTQKHMPHPTHGIPNTQIHPIHDRHAQYTQHIAHSHAVGYSGSSTSYIRSVIPLFLILRLFSISFSFY